MNKRTALHTRIAAGGFLALGGLAVVLVVTHTSDQDPADTSAVEAAFVRAATARQLIGVGDPAAVVPSAGSYPGTLDALPAALKNLPTPTAQTIEATDQSERIRMQQAFTGEELTHELKLNAGWIDSLSPTDGDYILNGGAEDFKYTSVQINDGGTANVSGTLETWLAEVHSASNSISIAVPHNGCTATAHFVRQPDGSWLADWYSIEFLPGESP